METKNINEKLLIIQSELKAPKNQKNTFGGYMYRSCEDILTALKPLLSKTKTTINIADEAVQVGERYYIKATAALRDAESQEAITATAYAREPQIKKGMDEAQITGATSSYARKYALNGLFGIDDTEDADAQDNSKTSDNVEELKKEADKVKTIDELKKFYAKHKGLGKDFDNHIARLSLKLKENAGV